MPTDRSLRRKFWKKIGVISIPRADNQMGIRAFVQSFVAVILSSNSGKKPGQDALTGLVTAPPEHVFLELLCYNSNTLGPLTLSQQHFATSPQSCRHMCLLLDHFDRGWIASSFLFLCSFASFLNDIIVLWTRRLWNYGKPVNFCWYLWTMIWVTSPCVYFEEEEGQHYIYVFFSSLA